MYFIFLPPLVFCSIESLAFNHTTGEIRQIDSYAQCAIAIAGSVRPSEAADKISAPDVTSKTEFKRVISNTLLTSFVTFTSLKWIPFD